MTDKKDTLTNFGREVKKRLIDKGMTQLELAAKIGTSSKYVGHIMHGRKPGKKHIPIIAQALNIDLSRFEGKEAAS